MSYLNVQGLATPRKIASMALGVAILAALLSGLALSRNGRRAQAGEEWQKGEVVYGPSADTGRYLIADTPKHCRLLVAAIEGDKEEIESYDGPPLMEHLKGWVQAGESMEVLEVRGEYARVRARVQKYERLDKPNDLGRKSEMRATTITGWTRVGSPLPRALLGY